MTVRGDPHSRPPPEMTPESHPLSLSRDIGNWLWHKDRDAVTDSYEPLLAAVIAIPR